VGTARTTKCTCPSFAFFRAYRRITISRIHRSLLQVAVRPVVWVLCHCAVGTVVWHSTHTVLRHCVVGAVLWVCCVVAHWHSTHNTLPLCRGYCAVGAVLWVLCCGYCAVGTVLWVLCCGFCAVGAVLWYCAMGTVPLCCGYCVVGTVLWELRCGCCATSQGSRNWFEEDVGARAASSFHDEAVLCVLSIVIPRYTQKTKETNQRDLRI